MLISYFIFGTLVGTFMTFIWSSNGGLNCLIKTGWVVFAGWSALMIAVTLFPQLMVAQPWN